MFGGEGTSGFLNDTWSWTGKKWVQQLPSSSLPPRMLAGLATDTKRGNVVLFGGFNPGAFLSDTWTWDGTMWTQQFPANHPSPRYGASMAYDLVTGTTVLFGGWDGGLFLLSDTWAWDGTDWSLASTNGPPERFLSSMLYDGSTKSIVLVGGAANSPTTYSSENDTWTWTRTGWIRQQPSNNPPDRLGAALAFDQARGTVVMFGGQQALNGVRGQVLADTWEWDGQGWSQDQPLASPSGRAFTATAYDATTTNVFLSGGGNLNSLFGGQPWPNLRRHLDDAITQS
jgi:hypothetical protein